MPEDKHSRKPSNRRILSVPAPGSTHGVRPCGKKDPSPIIFFLKDFCKSSPRLPLRSTSTRQPRAYSQRAKKINRVNLVFPEYKRCIFKRRGLFSREYFQSTLLAEPLQPCLGSRLKIQGSGSGNTSFCLFTRQRTEWTIDSEKEPRGGQVKSPTR